MLALPQDLTLVRDEYHEVRITDLARKVIEQGDTHRTAGIHVSDLLDPLRAWWRTKFPEKPDDRTIWLWLVGRVLHQFLISLEHPTFNALTTDSGTKEALGIFYSPDHESFHEGRPAEIKTSRAVKEPETPDEMRESYHQYLEQLGCYMVLENILVGYLVVLFLNLRTGYRTTPSIRVYKVSLTEEGFYTLESSIAETRDALSLALESDDPRALPLCREWLCGETMCPWWGRCQPPGRYGLPKKQWTA